MKWINLFQYIFIWFIHNTHLYCSSSSPDRQSYRDWDGLLGLLMLHSLICCMSLHSLYISHSLVCWTQKFNNWMNLGDIRLTKSILLGMRANYRLHGDNRFHKLDWTFFWSYPFLYFSLFKKIVVDKWLHIIFRAFFVSHCESPLNQMKKWG